MDKNINLRLQSELLEELNQIAKKRHTNRSHLIRDVLWNFVEKEKRK
jgi:metal-responsive CopG/Arc/MetJ family transcriptional regulator